MPASPAPRHRAAVAPRRSLAVAIAVVVTALSVGGAVGFGPGAAVGETDRNQAADSPAAADSASETDGSATSPEGNDDASGSSDDTWMITDEGRQANQPDPAADPKRTDKPADKGDHHKADKGNAGDKNSEDALPPGSGHGRRIVFDISDQHVWLVGSKNQVTRTYPVSGSRYPDTLKPGTYRVYSMSRNAVSYDLKETMQYMVRFTHGERAAIGFHDIPVSGADGKLVQTRAQLGEELSAGCIRQWVKDARALWNFSHLGTKVVVTA